MDYHTSEEDRYLLRGVSSSKEDVHKAVEKLDKGLFPKAFCKIIPDYLTHDPDYCLVMHADGAGTKSSLAYVYWKETSDLSVWRGIAQDAIVMNTDDLICVGAYDNILLSSTIGRNKHRIPAEVISEIILGNKLFADNMRSYGINITLTGGETADVGDLVNTIIVDSTVCARMKRSEVIDNSGILPSDVIVGLCSYGKAVYEDEYNGGIGSNGLTAGRHDLFSYEVGDKYPESYNNQIPKELAYTGIRQLLEIEPQTGITYGKLLLSPTRTYAPVIKEILSKHRKDIHGIIHCSGGGQTKILNFIEGLSVIKDNLFPLPPLFSELRESSLKNIREMYKVFNMGHRMEICLNREVADSVCEISHSFGVDAKIIGHLEPSKETSVKLITDFGEFVYEK
ncbi:MAG: AIR synthase-related protein [Bacteroidales bacterium]|nr:AIR synthase-related protein [Bacteroidales bacterium]MDD2424706.1 AIR synthase-related protein [Bacteroidales bacterium]MDD3989273.1 AIR synthase-related protein [Bacteroidales bacterium]MDD4639664.1 AIR synthase-related protein [Bacteroidales bacterium]